MNHRERNYKILKSSNNYENEKKKKCFLELDVRYRCFFYNVIFLIICGCNLFVFRIFDISLSTHRFTFIGEKFIKKNVNHASNIFDLLYLEY